MPFPMSPFDESFKTDVLITLKDTSATPTLHKELESTLQWLCRAPTVTSFRVNTGKSNKELVKNLIQTQNRALDFKIIVNSPLSEDIIILKHLKVNISSMNKFPKEVIVDVDCATALLRGAHIYAPGVMAMVSGTQIGDYVSVYADLSKKCRKGFLKIYSDGAKLFIGNGLVKMSRDLLFGPDSSPKGIAVEMIEVTSGSPQLGNFLPEGYALLQNLPSILCVELLSPKRGENVLDMCAAPGHKTTHMAALMGNQGTLVAIDKTPNKVLQLQNTCQVFGAEALVFQADSTKILSHSTTSVCIGEGPPFLPNTFHRILLDAPCSALGKRPQFRNTTSEKVIRSYVPLQRKLFSEAVGLLKSKGRLVYSTCTITLGENEGVVSWALRTFDCLELVKPERSYGETGWPGAGLGEEERSKVQRFGPGGQVDSVGFFMACFVKR
ncbi:tRNA (cytosine(72)-C(5))-methyltransferase NSUN6 [Euwallacea fornicatus]|uniref:tRNA (cytosine(72)-C(5))-methyltransferase NSUN6 n=1 Tax=Euwallacea fornicatus TaxID=995702 RepID=UPI00338F57E2